MGQSSAQTVREIEDLRDRIESNVRELEQRLPQPAIWVKRVAGIAVGGGIGAIVLRGMAKKATGTAKKKLRRGGDDESGGGGQGVWIAALTAAVVGLGVVQFRQLQRINRSLESTPR